jgi:hypothetical protein
MSKVRRQFAISATFVALMVSFAGTHAWGEGERGLPAPVGRWSAEGDACDAIRGRDGTLVGAVSFAPGSVGRAFRLAGDGGVLIRHDPAFDLHSTGFTVALWIRGDKSQAEAVSTIMEKSDGSADLSGWALTVSGVDGYPTFVIGDGAAQRQVVGTVDVLDGRYHHVAGTWGGGRARLFVDAVPSEPIWLPVSAPARNAQDVHIGFGGGEAHSFLRGDLDEIEIYSRPLNRSDLGSLVASTTGPAVGVARVALEWCGADRRDGSVDARESGACASPAGDSPREPERPLTTPREGRDERARVSTSCVPAPPSFELSCRPATPIDQDRASRCRRETSRGHGSSSGVVKADYNGDGFADLAVGCIGEETPAGVPSSGAVIVIYGSPGGLTATDASVPASQFFSQNSAGVPGGSERDDRFGSALAGGDFNGDGFSDLAIGVEGEDVTVAGLFGITTTVKDAGGVVVIYGTADGLRTSGSNIPSAKFFTLNSTGAPSGKLKENSFLGSSLAWGDFDADGKGDLAVGAPGYSSKGAVWVLYGSGSGGLQTGSSQFWTRDDTGQGTFLGLFEEGDDFGFALAGADFDGDGTGDLAIGNPHADVDTPSGTARDSGRIVILFGVAGRGLDKTESIDFFSGGNFLRSRPGLLFGSSLAAGDFNGGGAADLAVGVPGDPIRFDLSTPVGLNAGSVSVLNRISRQGIAQEQSITQSFIGSKRSQFTGVTEAGDEFGFAVASGDFNADGFDDLAIGVPGQSIGGVNFVGEVDVLYGSGGAAAPATGALLGFSVAPQRFDRASLGFQSRNGDRFGHSLSAWNFGRNEQVLRFPNLVTVRAADLAIGAPAEFAGSTPRAGGVHVLYGTQVRNGLSAVGAQTWNQDSPGVPGAAEPSDGFGFALY